VTLITGLLPLTAPISTNRSLLRNERQLVNCNQVRRSLPTSHPMLNYPK